jgi:hypothetical protein
MTDTTITISIDEENQHQTFLLAALRAASLRCKVMEADINSIGIALKSNLIGCDTAVSWIRDSGLMWVVGSIPDAVGKIESQNRVPEPA